MYSIFTDILSLNFLWWILQVQVGNKLLVLFKQIVLNMWKVLQITETVSVVNMKIFITAIYQNTSKPQQLNSTILSLELIEPFQHSVEFPIKTSYLIYVPSQGTGFCSQLSIGQKWVNKFIFKFLLIDCQRIFMFCKNCDNVLNLDEIFNR